MDDRRLLEAAARAAGIKLVDSHAHIPSGGVWIVGAWGNDAFWNPLADDGDALRLALACGLEVREREARWWPSERAPGEYVREDGGDPYAATRRAIVRAAAAMAERGE